MAFVSAHSMVYLSPPLLHSSLFAKYLCVPRVNTALPPCDIWVKDESSRVSLPTIVHCQLTSDVRNKLLSNGLPSECQVDLLHNLDFKCFLHSDLYTTLNGVLCRLSCNKTLPRDAKLGGQNLHVRVSAHLFLWRNSELIVDVREELPWDIQKQVTKNTNRN